MSPERRGLLIAVTAAAVVLVPLAYLWQGSRLPGSYAVTDMGYADYGGGEPMTVQHHMTGLSVADLTADAARPADVRVTLTVRKERFRLASGRGVDGFTVNGRSPGPVIRAVEGQLVEVRLENASVSAGVALHWHGVDVPNAMDGVAGVTQDAVGIGRSFTYRFVASHAGTFWYHSHQVSHAQVQRGLFGAFVVVPRRAPPAAEALAVLHVYDGLTTVNGHPGEDQVEAEPGSKLRVRVVNTDNGATVVWVSGGQYRVLAIDGYEVHEPSSISGRALRLTAGGRADLEVTAPVRVELGGSAALVVGTGATPSPQPVGYLDLLSYGTPSMLPFDADRADRHFRYSVGRRPGFVGGRPGLWWSINGHLFPDVPMFMVARGDVVRMHIKNSSGAVHPMHLHGHHAVVLARDGRKATGSPWWVDSLDVASGHSYDIAFLADNPGIWMDHCHNLPHAAQGLVAHLMYEGVTEPYRIGGPARNAPE